MKQLLIVRHAKSSWDFINMDDKDRPLNERGNKDAPIMAKRLLKKKIEIDLFVSSTARRAYSTATYFAEVYDVKGKHIVQEEKLYDASAGAFYRVVSHLPDDVKSVALFSHNPGISDFANSLTTSQIDDMPTCGIFAVKADIKTWNEFEKADKEFWFFDYPKAEK